jgi:hypothetical protein
MGIEKDFVIRMSAKLLDVNKQSSDVAVWLSSFEGRRLTLPTDFQPNPDFLMTHAKKSRKLDIAKR